MLVKDFESNENALTHALHGCTSRAENNNEIQEFWLRPPAGDLIAQDLSLLIIQPLDLSMSVGVLCKDGTKTEGANILIVANLIFPDKCFTSFGNYGRLKLALLDQTGQW